MNDPNIYCCVCGQKYTTCQCERTAEWNRRQEQADADWLDYCEAHYPDPDDEENPE